MLRYPFPPGCCSILSAWMRRHHCPPGCLAGHADSIAQVSINHPRVWLLYAKCSVSKAQLTAFFVKVEADPTLKLRVDAADDSSAVVAIALAEGFHFSPASLARHLRG